MDGLEGQRQSQRQRHRQGGAGLTVRVSGCGLAQRIKQHYWVLTYQ